MSLNKETAKENLIKLTERFRSEYEAGKTDAYSEEDTKHSFIGPLLSTVLGWDITNRDEVVMEQKISRGRIDYGIKLNGKYVFFVEAKPVRADLEKAIPQAVQYCFNRKDVPFVLLTDFEGLMFFDATFKPEKRHAKKGLKINLKWDKYVESIDELWQLSKPAVESGSLEKLFTKKAKDRVSVDKAILEDLEGWRAHLAKDLHKNNPDMFHSKDRDRDADYLKEVTQKLLDRIIFIRFCEDRNLTQIRKMLPRFEERGENTGLNTMYILGGVFKEYEAIFNSDLFKPQEWEKDLKIEFKAMNRIIQETYEPYMFDAIPLEVLGNIYEQYLGYTLKLAGETVKAEEKPEVRKAGGVYYTPEYIVDYIVKNTVGKMLEELPEAKAKKLRILDPACGSGSFLIRAYEEMLAYYQKTKKAGKAKIKVAEGQTAIEVEDAEARLTIQEKAEILKTHIFGVDIDEQAVEVTKLSLMLKMLEGEWGMVKGTQLLPMLDKNIKCGNSLVSGSVLELNRYFGSDFHKVKPFNWEEEFKEVMVREGGFDCVIGNPPYVTEDITENESNYYKDKYPESTIGKLNTYRLFTHKGMVLLKKNGNFSYIMPNTYLTDRDSQKLREFLLRESKIKQILFFPEKLKVFQNVTQATTVIVLKRDTEKNDKNEIMVIDPVKNTTNLGDNDKRIFVQKIFSEMPEKMFVTKRKNSQLELIISMLKKYKKFEEFLDVYQGEVNVSINKGIITQKKRMQTILS